MLTALSASLKGWLDGTTNPFGNPFSVRAVELQIGTRLENLANLGVADVAGKGTDLIGVYDANSRWTGTDLTTVLNELYVAATSAQADSFTDTNSFYATDTVGAALVALGVSIGGTNSTTRDYTGGTGTRLTDNDALYTAINKLDQGFVDLIATTVGKGASLVGIQDAGNLITATQVEAALAELAALRPDRVDLGSAANGSAIPVTGSGNVKLTSAGAETRTLANPSWVGQELTIYFQTDGGDVVITAASAVNAAGDTHITFNTAAQLLFLRGIHDGAGYKWRVIVNDGTVVLAP